MAIASLGPSGVEAGARLAPSAKNAIATPPTASPRLITRGILTDRADLRLGYSATSGSRALSLTSVSASSAAGSEPATTPTPA